MRSAFPSSPTQCWMASGGGGLGTKGLTFA